MPNHYTNPNAFARYVQPDEPPETTALWESASRRLRQAWQCDDQGLKALSKRHLAIMYATLRKLRASGALVERGNTRPGSHQSQLVQFGEHWERRTTRARASLG